MLPPVLPGHTADFFERSAQSRTGFRDLPVAGRIVRIQTYISIRDRYRASI